MAVWEVFGRGGLPAWYLLHAWYLLGLAKPAAAGSWVGVWLGGLRDVGGMRPWVVPLGEARGPAFVSALLYPGTF